MHPYLALETLRDLGMATPRRPKNYVKNFIKAVARAVQGHVQDGHFDLHVLHRRPDLRSHRPEKDFVEKYFTGTPSTSKALGLRRSLKKPSVRTARFGARSGAGRRMLDAGGDYAYRVRGEEHMWTPDAIAKLHTPRVPENVTPYKEYAAIINDQTKRHLTCAACSSSRRRCGAAG